MNLVDIIIIIILLAFAFIGFQRGVFQSLVAFIGFIAIICLAYWLKNYVGDFLVLYLPFTNYTFIPGGSFVLNIITYQSIAFIIVLVVLVLIYKILLVVTGVLEKLLKFTVILGIPSKILGLIVGIIEGIVVAYIALYFFSQPFWRIDILGDSKIAQTILKDTPLLSGIAEDTLEIVDEINDTLKHGNSDNFDLKLTDFILKRKIASVEVMQKLVDDKKLSVVGIQEVIDKYKTGDDE